MISTLLTQYYDLLQFDETYILFFQGINVTWWDYVQLNVADGYHDKMTNTNQQVNIGRPPIVIPASHPLTFTVRAQSVP